MKNVLNLVSTTLVGILFAGAALAAPGTDGNDTRYEYFYSVNETAVAVPAQNKNSFMNPMEAADEFMSDNGEWTEELRAAVVSLLNFDYHKDIFGAVNERYQRSKHFGTWIRDEHSGHCYNTRGEVLVRDSMVPVTNTSSGCSVAQGAWKDPYAGGTYYTAAEVEIDHFVPLKNAYVSGAYRWDYSKRCLYGNYMGNKFHLLSVVKRENRVKLDRGPEEYMPPNKAYRCQYLAQWLKVKMIWGLELTPPEKDSIESLVKSENCNVRDFVYAQSDLLQQRANIQANMNLCH